MRAKNGGGLNMTMYLKLVFGILAFETVVFALLAVPLPTRVRRPLTKMLAKPFKSPKLQLAIKMVLGFILLLFIDTINRLYVINKEYDQAKGLIGFGRDRLDTLSRRFTAQRNMYLTGITLFLTFIIVRTFNIVLELFSLKESSVYNVSDSETEAELSRLIKEKNMEISRLKEQAEALAKDI